MQKYPALRFTKFLICFSFINSAVTTILSNLCLYSILTASPISTFVFFLEANSSFACFPRAATHSTVIREPKGKRVEMMAAFQADPVPNSNT